MDSGEISVYIFQCCVTGSDAIVFPPKHYCLTLKYMGKKTGDTP